MNNNAKILTIFSLFLAYLLIGCTQPNQQTATPNPSEKPVASPTITKIYGTTPENPINLSSAADACLTQSTYPDSCLKNLMTQTNHDAKVCELIKTESDKDYCYRKVAWYSNSSQMCSKVKNQLYRDYCLSKFENKISICENSELHKLDQGECYLNTFALAEDTKDLAICGQMPSDYGPLPDLKRDCFTQVVARIGDPSLCEKYPVNKDTCYLFIVERNKNPNPTELCEKIVDNKKKDSCFCTVVTILNDKSLCQKIQSDWYKRNCVDESGFVCRET